MSNHRPPPQPHWFPVLFSSFPLLGVSTSWAPPRLLVEPRRKPQR